MKQLTVYKASAGSGKTFTLATEYMTMVINNPMAYRNILAVTFTNKATEEMKQRILSQLYGIAKGLKESNGYFEKVHEALPHLSEKQIRDNAACALKLLIHNYSYFRVETIDSFFQSVFRNLARELNLTANLRIGLNDLQVEQNAVDELIEGLEANNTLLAWIMEYIKENIDDDKTWNVISSIKSFGKDIFKDFYKAHADEIAQHTNEEAFFNAYKNKLITLRKQIEKTFQDIATTFYDTLEENHLTVQDFNYANGGVCGYFNKLRNGIYDDDKGMVGVRVQNAIDAPEGWVTKANAHVGNPAFDLVNSTLLSLLRETEEQRPKLVRIHNSVTLTLKHLNNLRLLSSIDKKVKEMNQNANRFLLSDTQSLLHSLIKDSDSPFVFEKIGTQLEHVMIDEFQDTSTIQWQNFKVLLEETMSHEKPRNLIVGDVKQSIYRFRNGDWRLLNNIEGEFTKSEQRLQIENLNVNYRSEANIIEFNNAFFKFAPTKEAERFNAMAKEVDETWAAESASQIIHAYNGKHERRENDEQDVLDDVHQDVPKKKKDNPQGFVRVQLITEDEDENKMMQMTLNTVKELASLGVPYNKMAILMRNNMGIQQMAAYFMENSSEIPIVSDEAFRLDASQVVLMLVGALQLLMTPADLIIDATLRKYAAIYCPNEDVVNYIHEHRDQLLQIPLYDLVEKLFEVFHFGDNEEVQSQSAYICAFYDHLSNFLNDYSCDIPSFLEEWESTIRVKSIHCSTVDGIKFITIHKSKGLEFDNVIMPSFDWQERMDSFLWCSPQEPPFNELPLVPVDASGNKKLKNSIYAKDYYEEELQVIVDNLNLLYVAFTRPARRMFIYAKQRGETYRSNLLQECMDKVKDELERINVKNGQNIPILLEKIPIEEAKSAPEVEESETRKKKSKKEKEPKADILFEYGILSQERTQEKNPGEELSPNVFTQPSQMINVDIHVNADIPEFRQSNQSRDFIEGDEDEEQQKFYIKMGTVLHHLFSNIHTIEDINDALSDLEREGVLYDENVSKERIEKMIRKRFDTPQVKDWFSTRWTILNECSILCTENHKTKEYRPDRVMKDGEQTVIVDFKFGAPKPEYQQQVRQYMSLMTDMGESHVTGYLWYVYPNKIEEVKA